MVDPVRDDRQVNLGPEARTPDAFVIKNFTGLVMGALTLVLGGGGGLLGTNLSSKIDATSDKIDKSATTMGGKIDSITLALTELKGQVTASEQGSARHDAAISGLTQRLSALEQAEAGNRERVTDHDRRLTKLEGK
jgi:hypothetical protein